MDDLDRLLLKRSTPQADESLAERIILSCPPQQPVRKQKKQEKQTFWHGWMEQFRPAYAYAAVILLIFGVGLITFFPAPPNSDQVSSIDEISTYIVYDTLLDIEAIS